jgi:membrane associated rhomboid family serine protease
MAMRSSLPETIKSHAGLLFGLLAAMWAVELADFLLPFLDFDRFGIRPRSAGGLVGIVLSPFLHGDFGHLAANSLPFLALGGVVMLGGRRVFLGISVWVVLVGGFGVWVFGRSNSVHIGASLLIFGYLGFLLSRGIFERSVVWVLVSVAILIAYGGMIHGVLPGRPGISWLGHLCGFFAGVAGAWLMFPKGGRLYGSGR